MIAKLITAIEVEKLFGLYTYRLPVKGELSNAAILYGDNGIGKSTLLRLAFHLLSTSNNRGHRTALINTDFKFLRVELNSGTVLSARSEITKKNRILVFEIHENKQKLAVWKFDPDERESENSKSQTSLWVALNEAEYLFDNKSGKRNPTNKDQIPSGNRAYLSILAKYVPRMFILNADRRLDSDSVADPDDEIELRRVMRYEEPKHINELVVRSREIALSQAMNSASKWISNKAMLSANQGSMNVHSVYADVLRRLVYTSNVSEQVESGIKNLDLIERLNSIELKTNELSNYELAATLSTSEFRKTLNIKAKKKSGLAADLLEPYVQSLEGRLDAVNPIYQLLDKFIKIVNNFLTDKSITFKLSKGFIILNKLNQPLSPAQLSSGEQQLLLLFYYVLTARDQPSVFMIDEPEISLNIKWQRQLIQSLLDITDKAQIQFIFASHSMELLTKHKDKVVKLVDIS